MPVEPSVQLHVMKSNVNCLFRKLKGELFLRTPLDELTQSVNVQFSLATSTLLKK